MELVFVFANGVNDSRLFLNSYSVLFWDRMQNSLNGEHSETFGFFLNDSRVDFEAHEIFVVGLQRPVHDELDLRVDFENFERVAVDVRLAF